MPSKFIRRARLKRYDAQTRPRLKKEKKVDGRENGLLSVRNKIFVSEFASTGNATQSAIKAGYSKNGAHVTGHRLLSYPKIAKAVELTQRRRLTRADITAERVLTELAAVGLSETDPSLPKPSDKIAALNTLAKHLGLLVERHEVDQRMSILNVNVSQADLESARQLVESTLRGPAPVLEGKVEPEDK